MQRYLVDAVEAMLRSSGADPVSHQSAYDQCLWAIVTADRDELDQLVRRFPEEPHLNLPIPLQVVAARLLGLEPASDAETTQLAAGWIGLYCDPGEEKAATRGMRARLQPMLPAAEPVVAADSGPE